MSELGQVLQRAREEKQISLDDIMRVTKIQRRYLEAIERGHYHLLPGHFYARAFIKSYAEAVGLDPNEIMTHFQSDLPAQPPQEQLERLRRRRAASKEPLQASRWVTQTLLVLFVVLVIGVIYMAVVNRSGLNTQPVPGNSAVTQPNIQQPGNPGAIAPATPQPSQLPATQPAFPPVDPSLPPPDLSSEAKATLTFEAQQGKLYTYSVAKAESLKVKIVGTTDKCWLQVREKEGGKKLAEMTLKQGEEKLIEAGKTVYMVVGKPSAVQISINDNPVDMSKLTFFPSYVSVTIQEAK